MIEVEGRAPIVFVPTKRRGEWHLTGSWTHPVNGSILAVVPPFSFDLASVPRLLWIVPGYAPMELSVEASLAHDFLYRYRGRPPKDSVSPYRTFRRRDADRYFLLIMEEQGIANPRRRMAWLAVRLMGWLPWYLRGTPAV